MKLYSHVIIAALNERGFNEIEELCDYVSSFLLMRSNHLYLIDEKLYIATGLDVYRREIRLLQTSEDGFLLYDQNNKTIKHKMKIKKFEEKAAILVKE